MKKLFILFVFSLIQLYAQAQVSVSGVVKDASTGETLIGANVVYAPQRGVETDVNGKFTIPSIKKGTYTFEVSYVGYKKITRNIVIVSNNQNIVFNLQGEVLDEVVLVADIAQERKTPVAFTSIEPKKIEEELGGRDIPLILNQTPGAYATQQGGGDGDARINIRGFKQENMAVLIDGIPVNDMETGAVYWSNWFGLNTITSNIQVQRGLSASKLSIPSVGGTMNILTTGANNKKFLKIKQSFNQFGKSTTDIGYNSGFNDKGWNFTGAFSAKKGRGFVENTDVQGFFAYAKVSKRINKHLISLSGFVAPQEHDQRRYKQYAAVYDTTYAKKIGVDMSRVPKNLILNQGIGFNRDWGYLKRNKINSFVEEEKLAEKSNFYNKPQINLNHSYTINPSLQLNNAAYVSIGRGGGVSLLNDSGKPKLYDTETGLVKWQSIYDQNVNGNPIYSVPAGKSTNYLIAKRNDHNWFGLLSKLDYDYDDSWNISGGLDLRSYEGRHYNEIHDLLGGDYAKFKNPGDSIERTYTEGGIIEKDYTTSVKWAGAFAQAEYSEGNVSAFLNLSTSSSTFKKHLDIQNNTKILPFDSEVLTRYGGTIKTGLNYNLDEKSNIFVNVGYLNKVRNASDLFQGSSSTLFRDDIKNEQVFAEELGYNFKSEKYSISANAYYTKWLGKAVRSFSQGDRTVSIPGVDARHMGLEIDGTYKFSKDLDVQGTVSVGDWIWTSNIVADIYEDGQLLAEKQNINVKDLHVGDAPQTQLGLSVNYKPIKGGFVRARYMYNTKYYSDFNINDVVKNEKPVDPWKIPAYGVCDLTVGYGFKMKETKINWTLNVFNVFNTTYVAGASNNDTYADPEVKELTNDATSATVFLGMGRMLSTSIKVTL